MKVLINITSYNRPLMLKNLLTRLKGESITVWDDCSGFRMEGNGIEFYKFDKNYGKKLAYQKFKLIFEKLRKTDYDYYIFLADDYKVDKDFVKKAVKLWEGIDDKDKISLSFAHPDRCLHPNWTGLEPREVGDVILTGWNDLAFICSKKFLQEVNIKEIPMSRWEGNELLSSGVGAQISKELFNRGFNMYNTKKEIAVHIGNDDSKMNPVERSINKL